MIKRKKKKKTNNAPHLTITLENYADVKKQSWTGVIKDFSMNIDYPSNIYTKINNSLGIYRQRESLITLNVKFAHLETNLGRNKVK